MRREGGGRGGGDRMEVESGHRGCLVGEVGGNEDWC